MFFHFSASNTSSPRIFVLLHTKSKPNLSMQLLAELQCLLNYFHFPTYLSTLHILLKLSVLASTLHGLSLFSPFTDPSSLCTAPRNLNLLTVPLSVVVSLFSTVLWLTKCNHTTFFQKMIHSSTYSLTNFLRLQFLLIVHVHDVATASFTDKHDTIFRISPFPEIPILHPSPILGFISRTTPSMSNLNSHKNITLPVWHPHLLQHSHAPLHSL